MLNAVITCGSLIKSIDFFLASFITKNFNKANLLITLFGIRGNMANGHLAYYNVEFSGEIVQNLGLEQLFSVPPNIFFQITHQ